jgi:hypothetical protein
LLQPLKRLLLLGALAAAVVAATVAAPASASTPCWKLLINDWLDGRIDQLYPVACYHQAIDHLPADIEQYSSARQDIQRALQARLLNKHAPANHQSGGGGSSGGGGGGTGGGGGGGSSGGGPVNSLLDKGRPSKADSVPLPIIVLAAIAGFLLLLGAAGFFARRMQSRRPLRPAQSPSPPQNQ